MNWCAAAWDVGRACRWVHNMVEAHPVPRRRQPGPHYPSASGSPILSRFPYRSSSLTDVPTRLSQALADRYRIERELGQGGMATIHLDQEHRRLERPKE